MNKQLNNYNQRDHYHCWQQENPPCGQKIEHLKCCLCELPNPKQQNNCCECEGDEVLGSCRGECLCHQPQKEWDEVFENWGWLADLSEQYPSSAHPKFLDGVINHISTNFISKKHLKEVIEGMERTEKDWDGNYSSDPVYEEGQGYNQALEDLSKKLELE